ncbi:MAG: PaaI family thioesterase [Ignavibacteriales bacterium]
MSDQPEEHFYLKASLDVPLHNFLGLNILSYGDGRGEISIPIGTNVINAVGAVHGAVYYALCDIVGAVAYGTIASHDEFSVTNDINVSILSASFEGELRAEGAVIKAGKRLVFVETKVFNNDKLVAVGRITKTVLAKPTLSK